MNFQFVSRTHGLVWGEIFGGEAGVIRECRNESVSGTHGLGDV